MRWLQRFVRWLFPRPLDRLLREARGRGRTSMAEVDLGRGEVGWYVSIRPAAVGHGNHAHRYAWTGQDFLLEKALQDALDEANEFPVMIDMTKDKNAPKLGGREFDEE